MHLLKSSCCSHTIEEQSKQGAAFKVLVNLFKGIQRIPKKVFGGMEVAALESKVVPCLRHERAMSRVSTRSASWSPFAKYCQVAKVRVSFRSRIFCRPKSRWPAFVQIPKQMSEANVMSLPIVRLKPCSPSHLTVLHIMKIFQCRYWECNVLKLELRNILGLYLHHGSISIPVKENEELDGKISRSVIANVIIYTLNLVQWQKILPLQKFDAK